MKPVSILLPALISILLAPNGMGQSTDSAPHWVGSWAASQQIPEPQNAIPEAELRDATLRQIVHLSVGGASLRVHLSNAFGTQPLHLGSVHIARMLAESKTKTDAASDKVVTFFGSSEVIIPAGAEYISDALDYRVAALADLAISIHYDEPPALQSGHPGSRATSYLVRGDAVSAPEFLDAKKIEHWYQISAIDVAAPPKAASIVALGDSITDGHGATTNGNDRWTDILAQRLQASSKTRNIGVLNQGIGGNHLLTDGLGPNALARFDRDVLAQTGVKWVILLEGVNDLGGVARLSDPPQSVHDALVQRVLGSYEQLITRAHAAHIKILGATILPYAGSDYYHPLASSEADRQKVNQWIRTPGHFDAVIDFDKAMADPPHPDHLAAKYDCGDHLHPSPVGYRAMGEIIPLAMFEH